MTWPQVALVGINTFQVVALAWIAGRQLQVKRELERVNGHLDEQMRDLKRALVATPPL